jgi:lysozyme family protein
VVIFINTFIIMADIKKVNFDYIKKWEGGLSYNQKDSAAKNPVPWTTNYPNHRGIHSNVGVTWPAWAAIFGRSDESIEDFYKMPKEKWVMVYKWYWDIVGASNINNQIISELLADWAWGNGTNACFQLQQFLVAQGKMIEVDGRVGKKTIYALNELIKEESPIVVYKALFKWRVEWIKRLPSFRDFGRGWMNRLEDFDQWALGVLQSA